jgi:hypothetical protein
LGLVVEKVGGEALLGIFRKCGFKDY